MHQQLLERVTQQLELQVLEQEFPLVAPQPMQAERLLERLERRTDLIHPDTSERTRAGMIVAPILIHLAVSYQLSLYSGTAFNVDIESGFSSTADYLCSLARLQQSMTRFPVNAVVETFEQRGQRRKSVSLRLEHRGVLSESDKIPAFCGLAQIIATKPPSKFRLTGEPL